MDLKEKARKLLALEGELKAGEDVSPEGVPGTSSLDRSLWNEAYSALINLGYRPNEVKRALDFIMKESFKEEGSEEKDLGNLITHALRYLAR